MVNRPEVELNILFKEDPGTLETGLLHFFGSLGGLSKAGHKFYNFWLSRPVFEEKFEEEVAMYLAMDQNMQLGHWEDLQTFEEHAGFNPGFCIGMGTLTRHPLAVPVVYGLAVEVARQFSGLIELDDPLLDPEGMDWQQAFTRLKQQFSPHPGQLLAVPYETANQRIWFMPVVDADFLEWLLAHQDRWPLLGR